MRKLRQEDCHGFDLRNLHGKFQTILGCKEKPHLRKPNQTQQQPTLTSLWSKSSHSCKEKCFEPVLGEHAGTMHATSWEGIWFSCSSLMEFFFFFKLLFNTLFWLSLSSGLWLTALPRLWDLCVHPLCSAPYCTQQLWLSILCPSSLMLTAFLGHHLTHRVCSPMVCWPSSCPVFQGALHLHRI